MTTTTTTTTTMTVSDRVANGVTWLDENAPGWRDKVNPDRLTMSVPFACVLGQVFADEAYSHGKATGYHYGLMLSELPTIHRQEQWARDHGFDVGDPDYWEQYAELTNAWLAELS